MAEHREPARSSTVITELPARDAKPHVVYRYAGDRFILVEYGEMKLDLTVNFRILGLNKVILDSRIPGVIETVPALRSILLQYDSTLLGTHELTDRLQAIEDQVGTPEELVIPSRKIELPMAFGDRWTTEQIARYVKYIRQDAPNVINNQNLDYAAQYNGLRDREQLIEYIMATDWWNACLGFWPGLPFTFPLDPRYAIVLPKYNPTRPWTPDGTVGLAGPCLAIYPVESPGGYQLFGRTIPVYDRHQRNPAFKTNPILLLPGDRIRFHRVDDDELESLYRRVYDGSYRYRITPYEALHVRHYVEWLKKIEPEAAAFRKRQEEAASRVPVP